jgi:energy-coupling factor transport system permease protein
VSRLVPLAAADQSRISEAATQRGPAATPVGRAAMANRLLAGSLDRAVDVAATLELRGYGMSSGKTKFKPVPSRYDTRFWIAGGLLMAAALAGLAFGVGSFLTYPEIRYSPDAASLSIAAAFMVGGLATWRRGGRVRGRRD